LEIIKHVLSLIIIGLLFWLLFKALARGGARISDTRRRVLDDFSAAHGLEVQTSNLPLAYRCSGGVRGMNFVLEVARERVLPKGSRDIARFIVRPIEPGPALFVMERRWSELHECPAGLHRAGTGDKVFDDAFVVALERDEDLRVLDEGLRAKITGMKVPMGGLLFLKTGAETELALDNTLDGDFYRVPRLEEAMDFVMRLASITR
jgi:hypothetical protein